MIHKQPTILFNHYPAVVSGHSSKIHNLQSIAVVSRFSFVIHKQPTILFIHYLAVVSRHSSKILNVLCSCCGQIFL